MPSNQEPWIEVKRSSQQIRYQQEDPGINQKYPWQAMFACQFGVRPFKEREKFRWGFSPAFLLDEATDRQKLFVESQLASNPIEEHVPQRTLALRSICTPGMPLQLALVAKTMGISQKEVHDSALSYCRELESVFPYDYVLRPTATEEEFQQLTGVALLKQCNQVNSIAQIRRFESPLETSKGILRLVGRWQSSLRADEQMWRVMAHCAQETLLNISIRPTVLLEGERRALLELQKSVNSSPENPSDEPYLQNYKAWLDPFINRHISPWNRYFYLQLQVAAPKGVEEYICRGIGTAITREVPEKSSPGFQVLRPPDNDTALEWINYLECLEMVHTGKNLLLPRLSELASLDEAQAAFRLPYPPDVGWPNTEFLSVQTE